MSNFSKPVWDDQTIDELVKQIRKPVDIKAEENYRQIGIRSHGKGIFYKEEVTGQELGNKRVFWVEQDCFIVNIVFAWEQAVAKTTEAERGMIASHRFPMYKPIKGKLNLDYLLYFFSSARGKYLLELASPGGAGRNKTLGQEAFRELAIPVPPFIEQQKIATILKTWDEAIRLTQELIAAKEQRKKGLMQQLLTGQVRFPGYEEKLAKQETWLGVIPTDWSLVQVRDIARVNAKSLGNSIKPNHEFYYIDLSSVESGSISFPTETIQYKDLPSRARRVLQKGDVIMATVRPNLLGYAICNFDPTDVLCSTGFALISPLANTDTHFIYQSIYSNTVQRQLQGLVTGSNYPAINSSEVSNLILIWPKKSEERQKIGEILRICDDEIQVLRQKLVALQQQKKGLMQCLLTGQLRVKT